MPRRFPCGRFVSVVRGSGMRRKVVWALVVGMIALGLLDASGPTAGAVSSAASGLDEGPRE